MPESSEAVLVQVFGDEWPRLVAVTTRIVGDLQTAEDVVQDVFSSALDRWPLSGVPERPGAWLMTSCRNRALNVVRDRARAARRERGTWAPVPPEREPDGRRGIADDTLRLMAMCCHPLLSTDAQIALTLRMVAGLTTAEIAGGFHEPTATVAQRIVRAKRTLADHQVTFATDDVDLDERLSAVRDVVFLTFNEGYLPSSGASATRTDLAAEAYRLARLLTELVPLDAAAWALRALIAFPLSRWATRVSPAGDLLTLDQQDRREWDQTLIDDGVAALARARELGGGAVPLVLHAELAATHATARSFDETDWGRILALYDELLTHEDTPVVALNRAVALAMVQGPAAALSVLDVLVEDALLRGSHRVWSVRADLHRREGSIVEAIADYGRALELVNNDVERRHLSSMQEQLLIEKTSRK